MLMKLLLLLSTEKANSFSEIAKDLNISMGLLELMMEDLVRLGYLRKNENFEYKNKCKSCSKRNTCSGINLKSNIWEITKKGIDKINKMKKL